jgi:hypothetical protein
MTRFLILLFSFVVVTESALAQTDKGAYASWLGEDPAHGEEVQSFDDFLQQQGVGGVFANDELLLDATNWKRCELKSPYAMPPRGLWPNIVPTLKFIRDEVVPVIGPVTVESGWREPSLNRCAGGAPKSAHAQFYALDLVPLKPMTRQDLIAAVCKLHSVRGKAYKVGLGFYDGLRFHIDTKAYRRWGSDGHGATSPCVQTKSSS